MSYLRQIYLFNNDLCLLTKWVDCPPMVRETWVQSLVASCQRLLKWYWISPCLTLSNTRYVSMVKWSNLGKGVAPSPTPRCSRYWKGSFLVAIDYGCQQCYLVRVEEVSTGQFHRNWTQCLIWRGNIYVEKYSNWLSGKVDKYPTWLQGGDIKEYPTRWRGWKNIPLGCWVGMCNMHFSPTKTLTTNLCSTPTHTHTHTHIYIYIYKKVHEEFCIFFNLFILCVRIYICVSSLLLSSENICGTRPC